VTPVEVRAATAGDVPAVSALEADLFGPDAWSAASVAEELTGPGRRAVVATSGGRVVGYAVTARAGDAVDLQRVAVLPALRRRGLAHDLLAALVDGPTAPVLLEVSELNSGAIALYRAEGFTEIGRRRRYYRDGTDAVVMARPVPEPGASAE
jgi:ribosomal protein S18 acetylase RimI-like enzyme